MTSHTKPTTYAHPLTPYGAYERIARAGVILPQSQQRVALKTDLFHRVLQSCTSAEIHAMARALKQGDTATTRAALATYTERYLTCTAGDG